MTIAARRVVTPTMSEAFEKVAASMRRLTEAMNSEPD